MLERKLSSVITQDFTSAGGLRSLVDLLNQVNRTTERTIVETLEEQNPELADEVRRMMFLFEDITVLDDRGVQQVLREVNTKELTMALKGVGPEVQDAILRNMSERAATNIREELEFMGPVRVKQVEEAQQKVVAVIRRLEEAGTIVVIAAARTSLSRSPLLRGASMSEESVAVPLRARVVRRADPTTPEGIAERAREDAEVAMAQAAGEADALRESARQEGFAHGAPRPRPRWPARWPPCAPWPAAPEQREAIEEAAVREATALAVEIAARIVRADVAANPERVSDVLRGAIRRAADRSQLVARVSPIDLAACREAAPTILEEMGGIARFEVVDDPRVMPGSCVLETSSGDVDATFESQLGRVLEALIAPPDETLVLPPR